MTIEELKMIGTEVVKKLWKLNKPHSLMIAASVSARYQLPPAALELIPQLPELMTALQQQSFALGVVAALYMLAEKEEQVIQ